VKLRHLLVEVAQRHDRPGTGLYLIQKQEVPAGHDRHAPCGAKRVDDPAGIEVGIEESSKDWFALEVEDVDAALEVRLGERAHTPGLADLTGAAEKERLTAVLDLP